MALSGLVWREAAATSEWVTTAASRLINFGPVAPSERSLTVSMLFNSSSAKYGDVPRRNISLCPTTFSSRRRRKNQVLSSAASESLR